MSATDPDVLPARRGERHATSGWVIGQYLGLIGEYRKSLEEYPNPKAVNLTQFCK